MRVLGCMAGAVVGNVPELAGAEALRAGGGMGARRVLQITELVRECLQQRDANCTILPAPPETCTQGSTATILQVPAPSPDSPHSRVTLKTVPVHHRP
jgi:hypothetical protein